MSSFNQNLLLWLNQLLLSIRLPSSICELRICEEGNWEFVRKGIEKKGKMDQLWLSTPLINKSTVFLLEVDFSDMDLKEANFSLRGL